MVMHQHRRAPYRRGHWVVGVVLLLSLPLARAGRASGGTSTLTAWGYDVYGEIGDGTFQSPKSPVTVGGPANTVRVAAGLSHTMDLTTDETVWTWGSNLYGELGNGTFTTSSPNGIASPAQVPGLSGVTAIVAGNFSLALKSDGTVWSWGQNNYGQLGNGTFTTGGTRGLATPAAIPGLTNVAAIAAGTYHGVALKRDGTVWTWGRNDQGQLGNGTFTTSSPSGSATPAQVPGISGVVAISALGYHTLALKGDGTVWSWGRNDYGQLGNGTFTTGGTLGVATPAAVPGLTGVVAVSAGQYHNLVLRYDGTIWSWGHNHTGELGNGTDAADAPYGVATAAPVPGLAGFTDIAAGGFHSVALRSDGTVWAWGDNTVGELGMGNSPFADSPAQVPEVTGVTQISAGLHTLALTGVDVAPQEVADHYSVHSNRSLAVASPGVLSNDTDPRGLPLTAQPLTVAQGARTAHGSYVLHLDGSFTYNPDAGYIGPDSFTYRAGNGASQGAPTTVSIDVRESAPVVIDDNYTTHAGRTLTVDAAHGVLANDTDADGDPLVPTVVDGPTGGSLQLHADGSFTYVPLGSFVGQDRFTYTASDGQLTGGPATVLIDVTNRAPLATGESYSTWSHCPLSVAAPGVLGNDADPDGDTLSAVLGSTTSHGALTLAGDGSFSYLPDSGFAGVDTFTYRAFDGWDYSAMTTVTLTVQNDATKPTCTFGSTVTQSSPPLVYVPATVTDGQSGVASVQITTNSANCKLVDPTTGQEVAIGGTLTYDPTLSSRVLRVVKLNPSLSARVELRVTDCSGNSVLADPITDTLEVPKRQLERVFRNLPAGEHFLVLTNGAPGLEKLKLQVNGRVAFAGSLENSQVLRLDLARWMKGGNHNTVRLVASGPAGASASLLLGDAALAGGASSPGGSHGTRTTLALPW